MQVVKFDAFCIYKYITRVDGPITNDFMIDCNYLGCRTLVIRHGYFIIMSEAFSHLFIFIINVSFVKNLNRPVATKCEVIKWRKFLK